MVYEHRRHRRQIRYKLHHTAPGRRKDYMFTKPRLQPMYNKIKTINTPTNSQTHKMNFNITGDSTDYIDLTHSNLNFKVKIAHDEPNLLAQVIKTHRGHQITNTDKQPKQLPHATKGKDTHQLPPNVKDASASQCQGLKNICLPKEKAASTSQCQGLKNICLPRTNTQMQTNVKDTQPSPASYTQGQGRTLQLQPPAKRTHPQGQGCSCTGTPTNKDKHTTSAHLNQYHLLTSANHKHT